MSSVSEGVDAEASAGPIPRPVARRFWLKESGKKCGAGWWDVTCSHCELSAAWAEQLSGCASEAEPFLLLHRHIENWKNLQTLNAVDMELYTGLQKL